MSLLFATLIIKFTDTRPDKRLALFEHIQVTLDQQKIKKMR